MEKKIQALLDTASVTSRLISEVERAGNQTRWCIENDVSPAYLSDVLKGRREPGEKILAALGLERITYYRQKA